MKTVEISLKNGKTYRGMCNGKIYGTKVYINRPANGSIMVTENGVTYESFRREIIVNKDDIKSVKYLD